MPQSEHKYIDTDSNPGFLDFSYHHLPDEKQSGEIILALKAPGDGNCGFYSIAFGLMHLIIQDKLEITEQAYQQFLAVMHASNQKRTLKERAEYYRNGIPIEDKRVRIPKCIPHIENFVNYLDQGQLNSFHHFKEYLISQDGYYNVLSMAICLAPALRSLSIKLLNENYQSISSLDGFSFIDQESRDGKDASFNQLNLLSGFFNFNLVSYNRQNAAVDASYGEVPQAEAKSGDTLVSEYSPPPEADKTIRLRHSNNPGHWDLLLPLSEFLSPPFYFGFDYSQIQFNEEDEAKKTPKNAALEKLQTDLLAERKVLLDYQKEINKLKKAASTISDEQDKATAKNLITILQANRNSLFLDNKTEEHQKIKADAYLRCQEAIESTYNSLHKSQPSFANLLLNCAAFLASLGIGYLVLAGIHWQQTGRIGFFHKPVLAPELSAFSQKFVELYQSKKPTTPTGANKAPHVIEPLPEFKQWTKIRI